MPIFSKTYFKASLIRLFAVSVVAFLLVAGGCASSNQAGLFAAPSLNAWVASEMSVVTTQSPQKDDPLIYDSQSNTIRLFSAANESLGLQIVIDPSRIPVKNVSVNSSQLKGRHRNLDKNILSAFQAKPVKISSYPAWYMRLVPQSPEPVEFFDALIPLDSPGFKAGFESSKRGVLWLDINVPRDARGGVYNGTVTVNSDSHSPWTANLELTVYDFVLPDARPLACVGGFESNNIYSTFIERDGQPFVPVRWNRKDPQIMEGLKLVRQLMTLSHEHRLDLFDKSIKPIVKRDMSGKMNVEWEDYDAVVLPYLDGTAFEDRIGCPAWPVAVHSGWPDPKYYGGPQSKTYASAVGDLIEAYKTHFAENLIRFQQFFIWPYRRLADQKGYQTHLNLAKICRTADPLRPILSSQPINTSELTGWDIPEDFAKFVDISAAEGAFFNPENLITPDNPENPLVGNWLVPGDPPYLPSLGIIAQPADVRAIPWFAMKYKCSGLFLPEVMNWDKDPFVSPASAETCLFYPGKPFGIENILPSIRLKRLRRGLEDIAYLWILNQRQRQDIARKIIDAMVKYGGTEARGDNYLDARLDGWVTDPQVWIQARKLLAEEVLSAVRNESPQENHQLLSQRIAWQQFTHSSQQVRLEQIRAKVFPVQSDPKLLQTRIWLELYNEFDRDVTVTLEFDNLPKGWEAASKELIIQKFPPKTRKIIEMLAKSPYLPDDHSGKMKLAVKMVTDSLYTRQITASVPFIIASAINKPIVIDGDLSDWPLRTNNSGCDFTLIGKRGLAEPGLAEKQTVVNVLRDENNLYLAIRCLDPKPQNILFTNSNIVNYQQLLACGEDLVEILIDPALQAKGPGDLYHMVIKPNGITITEKGVSTNPPLGKCELWPAKVTVAAGRTKDAWTIEAAIDLGSIPHSDKPGFWGINFARFSPQGAEASNWAQAPRYLYDPKNLGTMYFPPEEKKPF